MTVLKIKKMFEHVQLPEYATPGAACFDIRFFAHPIPHIQEKFLVTEESSVIFTTGLQFEIPEGYVLEVYSRSGHGFKNNVRLANCVGIIDSDYRGELLVKLANDTPGHWPLEVCHGDRIAQAKLTKVEQVKFMVVDELSETARGANGGGSTGVK